MSIVLAKKCKYCNFDFDKEREFGNPVVCPYYYPTLEQEYYIHNHLMIPYERHCPPDALKVEEAEEPVCYILVDTDEASTEILDKYMCGKQVIPWDEVRESFYSRKNMR